MYCFSGWGRDVYPAGIKNSHVLPRQPVFFKKSQDFWKWSGSAELLVTSNATSLLQTVLNGSPATTLPGYWPPGHFGFGIQEGQQPFDSASGQTWEGLLRGEPKNCRDVFCGPFQPPFGGFRKWWYPQIIHLNRDFHCKSSILGSPYFWKHPFVYFFSIKLQLVTGVFRWTWKFIRALSNAHLNFFQSQATKEEPHSGFADWEIRIFFGLTEILILPTADLLWFQNPNLLYKPMHGEPHRNPLLWWNWGPVTSHYSLFVSNFTSRELHTTAALSIPKIKELGPENRPFAPKGNDRILTIHFQVLKC